MSRQKIKVMSVFGTRPEAVKMMTFPGVESRF